MKDPIKLHFRLLMVMLITAAITIVYMLFRLITFTINLDDTVYALIVLFIQHFLFGWMEKREKEYTYKTYVNPDEEE